jgi:hypothetical protein
VHFRAGTDCPPALREAAVGLFDEEHNWVLPDERLGELEHFMTIASKSGHELRAYDDALDFVAGRRMQTGESQSSRSCSQAALPIPSCWRF